MQNSRSGDQGFYETLFGRRDVRSEFIGTPVPEDVLARIIISAHHAPSVGLSQPWNFIVIEGRDTRDRIYRAFCEANEEAAELFEGKRRDHYRQLKLQGILDAPVNLCITCDRGRGGDAVLGRTHQSEMDIYIEPAEGSPVEPGKLNLTWNVTEVKNYILTIYFAKFSLNADYLTTLH